MNDEQPPSEAASTAIRVLKNMRRIIFL